LRERRHEIHDREHRVGSRPRLSVAWPTDEAEGSDRSLGDFAKFPAEGAGAAHVRRSLVAHLAGGLTLWPVVRSEDDQRVVVDAEFLERVEDLPDVVIAFHRLVTELADATPAREVLRWKIRKVTHREWKV